MRRRKPYIPGSVAAHVRIPLEMLNAPAFCALSAYEVKLYVDMRAKLRSTNNGNIDAALSTLQHRGWKSPTTLAKCLRALEAVGLIAKTRATIGVENGSKVCNLYRFTDMEVFEQKKVGVDAGKATEDYKRFESLAHAKAVVRAARKNKSSLQKLERDATEFVACTRFDATDSVVDSGAKRTRAPKNAVTKSAETRANTGVAPVCPQKSARGDQLQNLYTLSSNTTPLQPNAGGGMRTQSTANMRAAPKRHRAANRETVAESATVTAN